MSAIQEKAAKAYARSGGKLTFPWESILQIIKDLLGGCVTNKAAQRWARRNEKAAREAIDEAFKGNAIFKTAKDRAAAVEATYETFINASRAELRQINLDD